jgi:hypothetical protein
VYIDHEFNQPLAVDGKDGDATGGWPQHGQLLAGVPLTGDLCQGGKLLRVKTTCKATLKTAKTAKTEPLKTLKTLKTSKTGRDISIFNGVKYQ